MGSVHRFVNSGSLYRGDPICKVCGNPRSSASHASNGSMDDNTWPIVDEVSLVNRIKNYQQLIAHQGSNPDNVVAERIPEIGHHIVNRAFELNLEHLLPVDLTDAVFADWANRRLNKHWKAIEDLAHQLARDTSREAGAG